MNGRNMWAYQLVGLLERGLLDVKPICRNPRERSVIKDNHRVRILRQPPHRQQAVIWVHNYISRVRRIRENTIRLYDLLREAVVQSF